MGYPEKELNATKEQQYDYYKSYATAYGMLFKDFLETMGTNEEEFEADVTAYAESMVAQEMALYALVREAGLTADDEMKEKAKADMLAAYGVEDEKEFEKQYNVKMKDPTVQNSIEMSALLYTALDYLADNAVEVEL